MRKGQLFRATARVPLGAAIADIKAEWERQQAARIQPADERPLSDGFVEAWADIQRADRVRATENTLGLCAWCERDGLRTAWGVTMLSRGAPLVTFDGRTVCAACGHLSGPTPCPVRECAHALEPRWTLARGVVQGCPVHGPGTVEDE
jgi:hypothetical protein